MDVDVLPEVAGSDVNVPPTATVPNVAVDVDVDVLPEVADVVADVPDEVVIPVQGLMVPLVGIPTMGNGALINGLIPALAISVEPRGIVPPLRVKVAVFPGVESGEAVPVEATGDDVQSDIESADPVAVDPPPSKVELMPVDDPVMLEPAAQFALIAGLKPPGSTSVAPSVRPVPPTGLEPGTPSGDVIPNAGVLIVVCAWPVPQVIKTAAVIKNIRRIDTSCTILPLLRMFGPIGAPWQHLDRAGRGLRATAHTIGGRRLRLDFRNSFAPEINQ